jgi:enoyl-CoA hydratase
VIAMNMPGVEYFAHAFEMNPRQAREFLMLGERMSAERAYEVGMVNRVVPRDALEATATELAAKLASRDRLAIALIKQAINQVEDLRGKRAAMDAFFHIHHFAHAQNSLVSGHHTGGLDAKKMSAANKQQAGES